MLNKMPESITISVSQFKRYKKIMTIMFLCTIVSTIFCLFIHRPENFGMLINLLKSNPLLYAPFLVSTVISLTCCCLYQNENRIISNINMNDKNYYSRLNIETMELSLKKFNPFDILGIIAMIINVGFIVYFIWFLLVPIITIYEIFLWKRIH